jgi:hypothetical protein
VTSLSRETCKLAVPVLLHFVIVHGLTLMLRPLLPVLLLIGLLCCTVQAQSPQPKLPGDDNPAAARDGTRDPAQDAHQDMLKELEIKRDENTHRQNIERAKESAQLGTELRDTYKQQRALSATDLKKLSRMEKLAHQLRSESGGSDDEEQLKDPPKDLAATLARMADVAEELRKCVEKTPRHVVSATIIAHTNELLELVRLARTIVQ